MRKFSTKGNGHSISQEDLLVAFSRCQAQGLQIDDVKEFYHSVRGGDAQEELNIDEVLQCLQS